MDSSSEQFRTQEKPRELRKDYDEAAYTDFRWKYRDGRDMARISEEARLLRGRYEG